MLFSARTAAWLALSWLAAACSDATSPAGSPGPSDVSVPVPTDAGMKADSAAPASPIPDAASLPGQLDAAAMDAGSILTDADAGTGCANPPEGAMTVDVTGGACASRAILPCESTLVGSTDAAQGQLGAILHRCSAHEGSPLRVSFDAEGCPTGATYARTLADPAAVSRCLTEQLSAFRTACTQTCVQAVSSAL